jgi:hypothetical protein
MDRLVPDQLAIFESQCSEPEGLRFAANFISPATLPLQPFQFGQFEGKRRVASFGFRYDYALRQLQGADPIPSWLVEIVAEVETFAGPGIRIQQILCTEYAIGCPRQTPLQIAISQTRRQHVGSLYARCRTSLALHDVRRLATCPGAQHCSGRGTQMLDHPEQWT